MSIQTLIANWRTTSLGLTTIITADVHLGFAVHAGTANENTWITALPANVTGIGLILAGDAAKSATKEDVGSARQDAAKAIETSDTPILKKP